MRTKKLLSVLLAMLLAVSMFSIISVGAIDDEVLDEETVAAEPSEGFAAALAAVETQAAVVPQVASIGYPTAIEIFPDSSLSGRWDSSTLTWDVYTRSAAGVLDGYNDLKGKIPPEAKVSWEVWTYNNGSSVTGTAIKQTVYSSEAVAALQNFVVYTNSTSTQERLYIKQGKGEYYGDVKVQMTLTVSGQTPLSDDIIVKLVDQSEFEKLLAEAQKIIDKDRYTKEYMDNFKKVVAASKNFLSTSDTNTSTFAANVAEVKNALQAQIDLAPFNYKLTGWEWLDNLLGNSFMGFMWYVIDLGTFVVEFFKTIGVIFEPMIAIGSMLFGLLIPLFSLISL